MKRTYRNNILAKIAPALIAVLLCLPSSLDVSSCLNRFAKTATLATKIDKTIGVDNTQMESFISILFSHIAKKDNNLNITIDHIIYLVVKKLNKNNIFKAKNQLGRKPD